MIYAYILFLHFVKKKIKKNLADKNGKASLNIFLNFYIVAIFIKNTLSVVGFFCFFLHNSMYFDHKFTLQFVSAVEKALKIQGK